MQKLTTRFIGIALGVLGLLKAADAQTLYSPVTVTGFTQDVVVNGPGAATSSATIDMDNGAVGNRFCYMAPDFVPPGGAAPANALPSTGVITSLYTGITYRLASYSANNSLRIVTSGGTGTLTFATPQSAAYINLLGASGNGISTFTATVNFTDGTTQIFPGRTLADWFYGTNPAAQSLGRVNYDSNAQQVGTQEPRIYEVPLALLTTNYAKPIRSIDITKTSALGALNIMAVAAGTICPSAPAGGTVTTSAAQVCPGASAALTLTGAATGPSISYQWQASTNGGTTWTNVPSATATTLTVTPAATTQYRVQVTCGISVGTSTPVTVTAVPTDVAKVTYDQATYCQLGSTAAPTATPVGGRFSGTPGLVINATTGAINLASSTLGAHTVTYTSAGFCPATATTALTIAAVPTVTLAFGSNAYCQSAANPAPVFAPAGGTFTGTPGLVINATTGVINLASSTAGPHTVTYTSAGFCAVAATATLTITAVPTVAVAFSSRDYCQAAANPVPVASPAGGTFTSTSGLVINAATGTVSLAQSTPGFYTVTYALANSCALPATTTLHIEATAAPVFYNIITPNNDGKNDQMMFTLPSVTGYTMQVFSRWGIKVWESSDPSAHWTADGNAGGTYYYWVRFADCSGQSQTHRGWLEVVK